MSSCLSKLSVLVLVLSSWLVSCSSGNSWYSLSSWLPTPEGTSQQLEEKQDQGRLFSGVNPFCGPSATDPMGECVKFSKCYVFGGNPSSSGSCSGFGKSCCQYTAPCNAYVKTRVAYWQSSGYPGDATGPSTCLITVKPKIDTCYIRLQFLDTLLTASTVDVCAGNTLTIDNQAEGDSSLICSSLDNYETFVRVRTTHIKFNFNLLENVRLTMRIKDSTYRYRIKITQVTCAQINGIAGGVGARSLDFTGRSLVLNSVDDSTQSSGLPKEEKMRYSKLKLRFRNELAAAAAAAATAAADSALGNVTDEDYVEFETQSPANEMEDDLNQAGVGTDPSPTQDFPALEEIGNVTDDVYDEFETQSHANDMEHDLNQAGVGTDHSPTQDFPALEELGNVTDDVYDEFEIRNPANDTENDLKQAGVGTDPSPTQDFLDQEETTLLQGPSGLLGFFQDNESELDNATTITLRDLTRLANHSGLVTNDNTILVRNLCAVAERDAALRISDLAAGTASDVVTAERDPSLRIVDSEPPADDVVDKAPYFGTVMVRNDGGQFFFCGATLIAPTYVLTAASCLLRKGYAINMYDIRTYFDIVSNLGTAPLMYATMWDRTPRFKVKRVVFHPMYDHNNFHYDIAVMELDTAVTVNTPIALPQRGKLFENVEVAEIGHGLIEELQWFSATSYRVKAKSATGQTRTLADCRSDYANAQHLPSSYTGQFIKDEMICVRIPGSTPTKQVCEGDQGGPVVTGFGRSEAVLVGIISGNQYNCIDPLGLYMPGQFPDIAVRITSVLDFINAATTTIQYDVGGVATGLRDIFTNLFNIEINWR